MHAFFRLEGTLSHNKVLNAEGRDKIGVRAEMVKRAVSWHADMMPVCHETARFSMFLAELETGAPPAPGRQKAG